MEFFDVNLQIGRPSIRQFGAVSSVAELFQELDGTGITRGVVWHIAQRECGADAGNAMISDAIAGDDRAFGCWTILPPLTDANVMTADFLDRMADDKIVALRAFPDHQRFQLSRATFGSFLDDVSERGIPLLMSFLYPMEWPIIYSLMKEYPKLTVVLCDLGLWGQDRQSWPLVENYPNVYLESSLVSLLAGGLETAVKTLGADRVIFGSGFPIHSPHAAVLDVLHAEISDMDKAKIAAGNLMKLIKKAAGK
ncbi:MAG: amidohydrolase family protein [bacterium]